MATEGGGVKRYLLFFLVTLICQMASGQGVGGNGVPGAGSGTGSGSIPATSSVLKGTGSAGSATAATPGTDFITPNPGGTYQTINQISGSTFAATVDNRHFQVSGFPSSCTTNEGNFTTQLECAWFSAFDYAVANTVMVEVDLGYGYYVINHSLYEPTTNFTGVSLVGTGDEGSSVILANAVLSDAVIYKNETNAGATWPQLNFRDFSINGQDQAQGCMRLWGVQNPVLKNISCNSIPNGAPFFYQFGEPGNYGQGWVFGGIFDNVGAANNGTISLPAVANRAVITPTVSGGGIATNGYVVTSGGTGYPQPSAEVVNQAYLLGNQNGTSDQPCTTMPTGLAVSVNGSGVVTAVTSATAASGCSGNIYVAILPQTTFTIAGEDIWASDSRFYNSSVYGAGTCFETHSGNTLFFAVHPTDCAIGIVAANNNGSSNSVFRDTELDTLAKWGFDFQGSGPSSVVEGTNTFGNFPSSFATFHLAATAPVIFGPQADLTVASTTTDYHEFLMPYGTYERAGYLPASSSVCPNDTVGSNLGCILQQPLTLPAIAPASSGTPTYSSNPFTLSSSAWISSAVANHKWVWQANENTGGTYHYLTMTPPDPLNSEMDLGGNVLVQPTGTATASANFNSPQLGTNASWWNGTANQSTTFGLSLAPASGTNPAEIGTIGFSNCSSGGCTLQLPPLSAPVTAPGFFPQSGAAGPYSTFFDDFYTGANMASDPIGSPTGDTCSPSDTYTDNNHPGNMLLTAGTAGTGTGIVCGLVSENPSITAANTSQGWTWETAVYVPVLPGTTAGAFQAGMAHTPNANPWTTGIGFYLSSANGVVNDWYCRYNSTSTDSGVAATVAWTRLTMVNDGTNVHWYIGGTQVCGTGVAIANMPSTNQYPAVWSATALSATSVTMAYDYINWQRAVSR